MTAKSRAYRFGIHTAEELAASGGASKIAKMDPKEFVKNVRKLPFVGRQAMIYVINHPGNTIVAAQTLGELLKVLPVRDEVAHGLASILEASSEGMERFLESQKGDMTIEAFKAYLIREINNGVETEMTGERGDRHVAGQLVKRGLKEVDKTGRSTGNHSAFTLCFNGSELCTTRSNKKWGIIQNGSIVEMVERNRSTPSRPATPLCHDCWPAAHKHEPTADDLTIKIEEVAAPLPPTAPNWIREVDKDKQPGLLGAYMGAEDHKAYDAPEEQENQSVGFKLDEGTATEESVAKKSEDVSRTWPVWQMVLATICLILTMAAWLTYGNEIGLVALSASCVLVAISASLSWFWRISRFQARTSKANNRFENLDGLAFRLAYVLEWMAKNRPADLNLLLKSGVTFQEARDNTTEKFPELISAALLVGRGEKIIPWWVSVADMADVAIQMPVLRRWARMAFASGGTIAVRAAVLATLFILLPLVFVYGSVILVAVFFLANGIAGFLHTFGVTETHSILGALTKIVSGDISVHGMELTASGDYVVPFWGLVISAGQIWAFRFLIIPFVAPIEGLFTGGEAAKISRYSGKEHITMRILRMVNNRLPESVRISIAPPSRLSPAELLELKQITGNPRVKHVALIVVLLGATAAFMGFLYRFMTFQSPLASVMVCMVLMVALLAEVTAMLGYLSDIVRKATQFFMIQDTMLNAFKAFVVVVIFVGAATTYTTTRLYSVHSARYDKWAQEELSKAQAPSTPKATPSPARRSKAVKPKGGIDQAACKRFPDLCK